MMETKVTVIICCIRGLSKAELNAIITISKDRMKSVVMADFTLAFSIATGSSITSRASS